MLIFPVKLGHHLLLDIKISDVFRDGLDLGVGSWSGSGFFLLRIARVHRPLILGFLLFLLWRRWWWVGFLLYFLPFL